MVVLGIVLAIILAIANKKLFVYEDPRIDQVDEMLPQAQCGACGVPGCRPFAEAVVNRVKPPSACTVNTPEGNQDIASFMGINMGETEKVVARLACAGGTHVAYTRAKYQGLQSCQAAAAVSAISSSQPVSAKYKLNRVWESGSSSTIRILRPGNSLCGRSWFRIPERVP